MEYGSSGTQCHIGEDVFFLDGPSEKVPEAGQSKDLFLQGRRSKSGYKFADQMN